MLRGRVLAREGSGAWVRCGGDRDLSVPSAVAVKPGDWVEVREDLSLRVLKAFSGKDFPLPSGETARLSRERVRGLRARATVLAEVRRYFSEQGFLEVEAPTVVSTPGLEVNISALQAGGGYLITSPEFAMKRLLVGGLQKIFATPRCFRSEEEGVHHSEEFTMLEWYRAFDSLSAIMSDTETIVHRAVLAVRGEGRAQVAGRLINVEPPWLRMSVGEAFAKWVGIELLGSESSEELAVKLGDAGIEVGGALEWDDLFYIAFLERVQPHLDALDRAILLVDWPAPLAALARCKPGQPCLALRFEAYVGGVELANAFDELTDEREQRRRFEAERAQREMRGLPVYAIDEKFMAALREGLPPCAGIALGIDRLAMLAVGAPSLREVSAFVGEEI